jgi:hypothetical protein
MRPTHDKWQIQHHGGFFFLVIFKNVMAGADIGG